MRLIDANKLKKAVGSYNPVKYTYEYGDVISVEDIDNAPTVDAEPVRHGSWVGIDDYPHETWECDQCGCIYEEMPSWTPNYCPNCGAKMDGSDE